MRVGDECVAPTLSGLSCGAGTHPEAGACVADTTLRLTCGTGTVAVGNECRVNLSTVCGTDTRVANAGTTCVGKVQCGSGTQLSADTCAVDSAQVCGSGTTWSGSQCVTSPSNPSFAAFTAGSSHTGSFFDRDNSTSFNILHSYRFVATDLTQGTADGWSEVLAPMIGSGGALHLKWNHNTSLAVSATPETIAFRNGTDSAGHCKSGLEPDSEPNSNIDGTYVNFFGWNSTTASVAVCGSGGSVNFVRELTTPQRIKMTFNVQFSDGSTWINKVLYAEYRHGT